MRGQANRASRPRRRADDQQVASKVGQDGQPFDRYSEKAKSVHRKAVGEYDKALYLLGQVIADQKNSETVQALHVSLAQDALGVAQVSKFMRRLSEFSLVLLGGGIGFFGNVLIDNAFTARNVFAFMVPISIGSAIYSYAIGRD